ncbi:MAG TPA: hypothetical protein VJV79_11980 [Polyangiaceae bacterium]|nr:hypothetical protein [Polyangiaceae bacterium]
MAGVAPWRWVPTAYLAEGIPYAIATGLAATLFKDLGYEDSQITHALASISIMWSLKPLYAGFLEMFRSKRFWVITTEFGISALLLAAAICLLLPKPFWVVIGLLWLVAAAAATQDICVDGVYVTTLDGREQAAWVGWAGAAWNSGKILALAAIVLVASVLQRSMGLSPRVAWMAALSVAALSMAALATYHAAHLPVASAPQRPGSASDVLRTFWIQWLDFFRKPQIWGMLLFIGLYRSSEGFLLQEAPLFMQASVETGGLGLCATVELTANCPHFLADKARIDGVLSTVTGGLFGVLGGIYLARVGLCTRTMLIMAACLNVPHVTLIVLSQLAASGRPVGLATTAALITVEKAGYSFGFVANMAYMMQQVAPGRYYMTHYALCTALMQLPLVPIQALSGPLAASLGYQTYFVVACLAALPSLIVAALAPFPVRQN